MSQSIDSYKMTYSISLSPKTRVKEMNYGQGYRQIVEDGFNTAEESWNIEFRPLDSTSFLALETILLNSVKDSNNFISWTPPEESTAKYYTAHDILRSPVGPNYWRIQATLRREFIL
jgi:phage-related protein